MLTRAGEALFQVISTAEGHTPYAVEITQHDTPDNSVSDLAVQLLDFGPRIAGLVNFLLILYAPSLTQTFILQNCLTSSRTPALGTTQTLHYLGVYLFAFIRSSQIRVMLALFRGLLVVALLGLGTVTDAAGATYSLDDALQRVREEAAHIGQQLRVRAPGAPPGVA